VDLRLNEHTCDLILKFEAQNALTYVNKNATLQLHNSGRTMALGLTQPLTEMSTRKISWGEKVAGAYG
jgi:hypothetical protein